jgi:hypothetical protein
MPVLGFSTAYDAKTRNVGEHGEIPIARFDQKVYGFRYNEVLRPAPKAAGFFVGCTEPGVVRDTRSNGFLAGTAGVPPAFRVAPNTGTG